MGLAVLPPRLATELEEVRAYLLDQPNQIAAYHIPVGTRDVGNLHHH